jgi:hypothetical protein
MCKMSDKTTFTWVDWSGKEQRREVNLTLDVRDFKGRAGMPWLIMACNTHLSINDLLLVMASYGYERTRSWVSRRRWIFFDADYVRNAGGVRNSDGQEARAYRIMDEHPHVSARELARILRKHGIRRGKDWVLKHRVH